MVMVEPFRFTPARGVNDDWIYAGLTSSFPNIEPTKTPLHQIPNRPATVDDKTAETSGHQLPPCKILQTTTSPPLEITFDNAVDSIGLKEQVLIFRYRGKFHAIDHQCPHRSYPLSHGRLYDIEDFGIVLSAGISCPKHGWAFDLFTGESDRGAYKMQVWEVQLREQKSQSREVKATGDVSAMDGKEVWVRKKQRIG